MKLIKIIALLVMASSMPNALNCMSIAQRNKTKNDIQAFLATDSANWTDQSIANIQSQINSLQKVEASSAKNFQDRLNDKLSARTAARSATQTLVAEQTRRQATEQELAALRTTLQETDDILKAMQQARKKYEDDKQKNSGALSKNEIQIKKLQAELAASRQLTDQEIARRTRELFDLNQQQAALRQQLAAQEAALRQQEEQLAAKERAIILQGSMLATSGAEKQQLLADLKAIETQRDRAAQESERRFQDLIARNKLIMEQKAMLNTRQQALAKKEEELQQQLLARATSEQQKTNIQLKLDEASKAREALEALIALTRQTNTDELKKLQEDLEYVTNTKTYFHENYNALRTVVENLEQEIKTLNQNMTSADEKHKNELSQQVAQTQDLKNSFNTKIQALELRNKQIDEMNQKIREEKNQIQAQLDQEKAQMQQQLEALKDKLAQQQKEANEIQSQLETSNQQLETVSQQEKQQLTNKITALQEKLNQIDNLHEATINQAALAIDSAKAAYEEELKAQQAKIKQLQQRIQELAAKPQTEDVTRERKHDVSVTQEAQDEQKRIQEEIKKIDEDKKQMIEQQKANTVQNLDNLIREAQGSISDQRLNELKVLLARFKRLDKRGEYKKQTDELEKAINAALDKPKQIVIETPDSYQRIINEIEKAEAQFKQDNDKNAFIKAIQDISSQNTNVISNDYSKAISESTDKLDSAKVRAGLLKDRAMLELQKK